MYNKTVWKTGDIIPADKMNNIENGIGANDIAITDIKKELVKTVKTSEKGTANGIATLDKNGKVSSEQLPESQTGDFIPNSEKGVTVATLEDGELAGTQVPNNIKSHIVNEENPHNVTADQIGLTPIDGLSGSNVQAVLQAISLLLKNKDIDIASLKKLFTANGAALVGLQPVNGVSGGNLQQAIISLADTISKVDPYLGNPVAISQGGTGAKDSQNAIYNLGARPNKNLARNCYFIGGGSDGKFPINQRGKKSYGVGYSIDSWKMNDYGIITILDDCIEIAADGGTAIFEQAIENPQKFNNAQLTFSTLAQQVAGDGYCYITSIINSYIGEGAVSDNKSVAHFTKTAPNNLDDLRIVLVVTHGCTVRFYGAKIEVGTTQTLARQKQDGSWELLEKPDYISELAKCERYLLDVTPNIKLNSSYVAISSGAGYVISTIPLPVPMRIVPTILAEASNIQIALSDSSFSNPESVDVVTVGKNFITLVFRLSTIQIGQVADIRLIDESKKWLLSAEL